MIENALFSIGDEGSADYLRMRLENISSAPSLTGKPSLAEVVLQGDGQKTSCLASVDIREEAGEKLALQFETLNYGFAIDKGLELLGFSECKAKADFSFDFKVLKDKKTSGILKLSLRDVALTLIDNQNEISKNIKEILTNADGVFVNAGYLVNDDGSIDLTAQSNIDDLIAARVGELIDELVNEATNKVKKELDRLLTAPLKENETLYAAFKEIEGLLNGNVKDSNEFKKVVDNKIKELEKKIEEIEKQLQDKVEDVIDDIVPDLDLGF
jgi:hypothetical protein